MFEQIICMRQEYLISHTRVKKKKKNDKKKKEKKQNKTENLKKHQCKKCYYECSINAIL